MKIIDITFDIFQKVKFIGADEIIVSATKIKKLYDTYKKQEEELVEVKKALEDAKNLLEIRADIIMSKNVEIQQMKDNIKILDKKLTNLIRETSKTAKRNLFLEELNTEDKVFYRLDIKI